MTLMNTHTRTGRVSTINQYGEFYVEVDGPVLDRWVYPINANNELYMSYTSSPCATVPCDDVSVGDRVLLQLGDGESRSVVGVRTDPNVWYVTAIDGRGTVEEPVAPEPVPFVRQNMGTFTFQLTPEQRRRWDAALNNWTNQSLRFTLNTQGGNDIA